MLVSQPTIELVLYVSSGDPKGWLRSQEPQTGAYVHAYKHENMFTKFHISVLYKKVVMLNNHYIILTLAHAIVILLQ
jgi:hypothetical protein